MRDRWIIGGYLVALVLFGAVAVAAFIHFNRYDDAASWVRHTEEVIGTLEQALGDLRDGETGQRGYLLTGADDFLEPYRRGLTSIPNRLKRLVDLTRDNPGQQERLRKLTPLVEQKLAFTTKTIQVFREGDREQALEMVSSREGKRSMDAIRALVAEMEHEERRLLAARMSRAQTVAWRTGALIAFGNGFAFALLCSSTILLGRELNQRRRLRDQLEIHKQREDLLAASDTVKRRLEAVLDEMPFGVLLADAPSGAITFHNRQMVRLYGAALPSIENDEGYDRLQIQRANGTPYPREERPILRALRQGEVVKSEQIQMMRADGSSVPVVVSAAPIRDGEDRVTGVVATFDDYTAAKRSEEQRRQAAMFREIFLEALGHDLRNPLSVVTTGTASLSRRDPGPAEARVLARMRSSADRIARMIDQLLDLTHSRLGAGIPIEKQRADLAMITRQALEHMEVAYPERTVELTAEGTFLGQWDLDRMAQVVKDLVLNAFEHGAPDAPVRVHLMRADEAALLEVHNEGNPIPPELLPLIFDPFRRASERRRMKSTGLGLGLYLALQIVRLHGGNIDVMSSQEAGTTFRVVLPV
jgi:PAS domain S-box-containing protein